MSEEAPLDPQLVAELEPSVIEGLEEWQRTTGSKLKLDRWMTAGNTKAAVAVVLVTGIGPPKKIILKACPPERLTSREPRLHTQALAESPPEFTNQHLVEQPFEAVECKDKWRVLFQTIAGQSLHA